MCSGPMQHREVIKKTGSPRRLGPIWRAVGKRRREGKGEERGVRTQVSVRRPMQRKRRYKQKRATRRRLGPSFAVRGAWPTLEGGRKREEAREVWMPRSARVASPAPAKGTLRLKEN